MEEDLFIVVRPGRCNTCKHHVVGEYSIADDFCEHWCELEENELPGWFPGMHLDHCLFPAASADDCCPAYEMIDLPPCEQDQRQPGGIS